MTRYERKLFFERLIALREAYREETHVGTELTIGGVFAFAEETYDEGTSREAASTAAKGASTVD
jgi:hypothetical protein